ncbi:MAG: hypothetical protein ACFFKA_17725 [Candidatus Thorarchaeota archaeon]
MTESNNEIKAKPSYDWNKAVETGQRDEILTIVRNEFIVTLLNDAALDTAIFTERLDNFTSSFLETLRTKFNAYFGNHPQLKEIIPSIPELCDLPPLLKTTFDHVVSQSFELLLEKIIIKPYGKITVNTFQLYKIFDSISKIIDEIQLKCTPEHLKIVFMDPSRILLASDFFATETYLFNKEGKVSINVEDFAKLLKCNKNELCITTLFFGEEQLFIKTESQKYQSTLFDRFNYIELELEEAPTENLQKIEYPLTFQISPDQFQYVLKKIDEVSEIIEFEGYSDRLMFSGSDTRAERTITFSKKDLTLIEYETENETQCEISAHSLTFLKAINSYSQLLEEQGVIAFSMKYDHPIKIEYEIDLSQVELNQNRSSSKKVKDVPIGTFKAITYLAPRTIENEEDLDENEENEF